MLPGLWSRGAPAEWPVMEPRGLTPQATRVIVRLRRSRRWLLFVLGAVAVGLLPWIAYLGATLPSKHLSHHWQVAWVGLDIAEVSALAATAVALLKRSPAVTVLASVAGTLLVCDAWFDVLTAQPGSDFAWALAFALLAELPLAALCFWIAFEVAEVIDAIVVAEERASAADPPPTVPPAQLA